MHTWMKKILLVSTLVLAGCSATPQTSQVTTIDTSYDETNASHITLTDKIQITGNGLSLEDNIVTISAPGTYILEGTSSQAKIVINSVSKGQVKLVCRNVSFESTNGPVITVSQASQTSLIIDDNTTSTITVSGSDDEGESAAIVSHDDLVVGGSGTLNITSDNDGIVAKDACIIQDVTMDIKAGDDGLQVNDTLKITDATLAITTAEGAQDANQNAMPSDFQPNQAQKRQDDMRQDASTEQEPNGDSPKWNGPMQHEANTSEEDSPKAKGIKCEGDIIVENTTLTLDCADDAIHTDANFTTLSSTISIQSGDDGIHADATLTINSGDISITKSYEGLEGKDIVINEGNIEIISSDDGINASDPSVLSSMESDGSTLKINGGNIIVDASGDGIDMNGDGEMNGGSVIVYGPTSDGDGALDYNGTFNVNGGTLLAGGSSGMAVSISQSSKVNCLMIDASGKIDIQDENGKTILTYSSSKQYANLVLASELLETGKTYTILQDGEQVSTITMTAGITDLSSKNNQRQPNSEIAI